MNHFLSANSEGTSPSLVLWLPQLGTGGLVIRRIVATERHAMQQDCKLAQDLWAVSDRVACSRGCLLLPVAEGEAMPGPFCFLVTAQ